MKCAFSRLLLMLSAATVPVIAAAAESMVLVPGDASVDGSFLQPYSNVWLYTARKPGGETRIQGLWTDQLQFVQRDGKQLLQRVQGTVYADGRTTSIVNVFDPKTMTPVESRLHGIDGSLLTRKFDGGRIVSTKAQAGVTEERGEAQLERAPYDFSGGMYGLLIATLPLRTHADLQLADVDEFENKARSAQIHVDRQEWVQAGARGKVHAWVATSNTPDYAMTFYVTRDAPYVIRLDMHKVDGGVDLRWEML